MAKDREDIGGEPPRKRKRPDQAADRLRERLDRRERRLPPWRDERPYGLGESPRDSG